MRQKAPSLQEALPNPSISNVELVPQLQDWANEAGDAERCKLFSKKAVRDAFAARVLQVCAACTALDVVDGDAAARDDQVLLQLSVLERLLSLIPQEVGDHRLAQHLLGASDLPKALAAALQCIMALAEQYPAPRAVEGDEGDVAWQVCYTGRGLTTLVMDIAYWTCPIANAAQLSQMPVGAASQMNGSKSEGTGRDVVAPSLLGPLLDLACMDTSLTPAYYSLRRGATGALRELVSGSRIAQRRLLAPEHAAAYATLMGRVLQECGDYQTQVDLFEVLYRCGRGMGEKAYRHLDAQMRGLLAQLVAKDASGLDLPTELQALTAAYNSQQDNPSVVLVEASTVRMSCPSVVFPNPDSMTVALGDGHLSLQVLVTQVQGEPPEEEQLDINYGNINRVVTSLGSPGYHPAFAGRHLAELQCKAFPGCLGAEVAEAAAAAAAQGRSGVVFSVGMALDVTQRDRLVHLLREQGVLCMEVSGTIHEPSQQDRKPRKMSMGTLPQSYHKQPLPLSRTTPASSVRPNALQFTKSTPSLQTSTPATGAAAAVSSKPPSGRQQQQHSRLDATTPVQDNTAAAMQAGALPTEAAAAAAAATGADAAQAALTATSPVPTVAQAVAAGAAAAAVAATDPALQQQQLDSDSQLLANLDTIAATAERSKGSCSRRAGRLVLGSQEAAAAVEAAAGAASGAAGDGDGEAAPGQRGSRQIANGAAAAEAAHDEQQQGMDVDVAGDVGWEHDVELGDEDEMAAAARAGADKQQQEQPSKMHAAAAAAASRDSMQVDDKKPQEQHKGKGAAAAAAKPPAAKPPSGKAKGMKKQQKAKVAAAAKKQQQGVAAAAARHDATQDSIEDPDLPSLPPPTTAASALDKPADADAGDGAAAAGAAAADGAAMPGWMSAGKEQTAAAPAGGTVTTPFGNRRGRGSGAMSPSTEPSGGAGAVAGGGAVFEAGKKAGRTAAGFARGAAAAAAMFGGGGVGGRLAAGTPGTGKRASRLAALGALGRSPRKAAAAPAAAEEAEGEAKAAMYDYAFPVSGDQQQELNEGGVVEMPAAKQGKKKPAAAAKGKEGKAASGRGKAASGRGRAAAKSAAAGKLAAATAAAAAGSEGEDQLQPDHIIGSNIEFDKSGGSGSEDETGSDEDFAAGRAKGGSKAGGGGKAGGRGKAGAAAKGGKRGAKGAAGKAAAAAAGGGKQLAGSKRNKEDAVAAAGDDGVDVITGASGDGDEQREAAAAAAAKQPRKQGQASKQGKAAAAAEGADAEEGHGDSQQEGGGGARRPSRAAKGKAVEAMYQQLHDGGTQAALNLTPLQPEQDTAAAAAAAAAATGLEDLGQDEQQQQLVGFDAMDEDLGLPAAAGDGGAADADGGFPGFGVAAGGGGGGLMGAAGDQQAGLQESPGDSDDVGFEQQLAALAAGKAAGKGSVPPPATAVGLAAADITPETMKITTAKVAKRLTLTAAADNRKPAGSAVKAAACAAAAAAAPPQNSSLLGLQLGAGAGAAVARGRPAKAVAAAATAAGHDELMLPGLSSRLTGAAAPGGLLLGGAGSSKAAAARAAKARQAAAAAAGQYSDEEEEDEDVGAAADQGWGSLGGAGLGGGRHGGGGGRAADAGVMAQLLSAFKGDDDGDDDADMEMLQAVLMRAFKSKQAKQKQKQAALVKEVHEAVAARLVELEEAMNSELSQLAAVGQAQLAALSRSLGGKMGGIAELKAQFEAQLNAAWQEYGETYAQLASVQEEVRLQAEKKRAGFKRKLAVLQQEASQLLASTEGKVARMRGATGMPPAMAAMLQALGA